MKILLVGDWSSGLHEEPACRALTELGHQVIRLPWNVHFVVRGKSAWRKASELSARLQNKYLFGPRFRALNRDILNAVSAHRPDAIFVYRATHVTGATLEKAAAIKPGLISVGYSNDDPFSGEQPRRLWRHFLAAVTKYDLLLAYRHGNVDDFIKAGAREVRLLRSWYAPWSHRPIALREAERGEFESDVTFVGHHERDGRAEMLERLVNAGIRVRIFGPYDGFGQYGWRDALAGSASLRPFAPTRLVWGDEYVKALCGAKLALCFLSKLNRDTYTRRCFEIPAAGTLLLAERTADLRSLFREGVEADYFGDGEELLRKVRLYLGDEALRRRVAEAGRRRVIADGHDVVSRMRQLTDWIEALKDAKSAV